MVSTKVKGLAPVLDLTATSQNPILEPPKDNTTGGTSTNLAPVANESVARVLTGLEGLTPVKPAEPTTPTLMTPKKNVIFNKDGTVTVTTTNALGESSTNTVSKAAYNLSLQSNATGGRGIGGVFAAELQALQEAQKKQEQGIITPPTLPNTTPQELAQVGQTPTDYQDPLAKQEAFGETGFAAGAGLAAGVGTGLATSAGVGPAAAAATALGVGTGGAALVVGALAGAGVAIAKMIPSERQNVKNANKLFSISKQNIATIINRANAGQITNSEAILLFNQARQDMLTAQRHLKLENQGLSKYLSGGYDEMVAVDTWINQNLRFAEQDLRLALLQPNPAKYTSYADALEVQQ